MNKPQYDWGPTVIQFLELLESLDFVYILISCGSVVGIATDYRLDDRGVEVWVPVGQEC
jgi:hypothetical protein